MRLTLYCNVCAITCIMMRQIPYSLVLVPVLVLLRRVFGISELDLVNALENGERDNQVVRVAGRISTSGSAINSGGVGRGGKNIATGSRGQSTTQGTAGWSMW